MGLGANEVSSRNLLNARMLVLLLLKFSSCLPLFTLIYLMQVRLAKSGAAALAAFISLATDPRYTAIRYALFSSLAAVPRTFINATTGYIVAATGWCVSFFVCFALALPAMMMSPRIAPWNPR